MEKMLKLAKGYVQEQIIHDLLRTGKTSQLGKYMKSQGYYSRYCRSFDNLFWRLRRAGYKVRYQPGKRGGDWTAYIYLAE